MAAFESNIWSSKALQFSARPDFESDNWEILTYYRNRMEEGEREAEDWLRKQESLRVRQEHLHKLEWEQKSRLEEEQELMHQVKERQSVLDKGRDELVALASEHEQFFKNKAGNRDKLLRIMEKTEPIQQDIYLSEGEKPLNVYSYASNSNSNDLKPKHIIRTLHLPSPQTESLTKERDQLLKEIEDQRRFFVEKINEAREHKRFREDFLRTNYEENSQELDSLIERLNKAQEGKLFAIRDIIRLKHEYEERERLILENSQEMRVKLDALLIEAQNNKIKTKKDTSKAEKDANEKAMDFAHQFRNQSSETKDKLDLIKDQYNRLQAIFQNKVADLEGRYFALNRKYQDLESRTKLENEGYRSEIASLQFRIDKYLHLWQVCPSPQPIILNR
ncbi:unnamed protein product [Blepharisma stoltei]|uniref:Uncharacterized protein n=1 Tax=Blepharisma stoltei TaxID=1481888 RepID=A0AAU9J9G0_9CILI|nr:unnamed protein product [Blepharisma stoltei]